MYGSLLPTNSFVCVLNFMVDTRLPRHLDKSGCSQFSETVLSFKQWCLLFSQSIFFSLIQYGVIWDTRQSAEKCKLIVRFDFYQHEN